MTSFRATALITASLVLFTATSCTIPAEGDEDSDLVGTVWELQQIQFNDGKLLEANPPQNYTIEFSENGEVFVQADCNRALGEFTDYGGQVSITMGPTTLAACPPGSIGTDFLQGLNNANFYFFEGDNLFIDLQLDSGTMQFSPAATLSLTGKVWELQDIQFNDGRRLVADPPANYTVEFADDGSLSVQADCNRGRGSFTTGSDNSLTIEPIATTMMACPEGSIGSEFVMALNNSALYFFQDDNMFIDMKFDSGTLRFAEAPAPTLVGPTWKLQQIQYSDGEVLIPSSPENYTAQFMEDGSLVMQADCNQGQGSYSTNNNRLVVSDIATTRAACPPGSLSDAFVTGMSNSAIFFFQDGDLFIDMIYDGGTMRFSAD